MLKSVERESHTNNITKTSKKKFFLKQTEKIDRESSKIKKRSEKEV
jgi:hypothetical protein